MKGDVKTDMLLMTKEISEKQLKRKNIFNNIIIFAILLFFVMAEPYTYTSMYGLGITTKVAILLVCMLFLLPGNKIYRISHINYSVLFVFIAFALILLVTPIIHQDGSNYYFEVLLQFFCAAVLVHCLSPQVFIKHYINVIKFLLIYSLIATYVIAMIPDLNALFPTFHHYGDIYQDGYISFTNMFFCNVYVGDLGAELRNFGVFREPGVWAIYILIAMILDLFWEKQGKWKIFWLVVWNVGAVSTFSPGIILFAVAVDCTYLLGLKLSLKKRILGLSSIILGGAILWSIPEVLEKITSGFDKFSGGGSYMSRLGSMIGSLNAFIESPLIGWGYTGIISGAGAQYFRQYTDDYTNTIILNFAIFGLIFGIMYIWGLVKFFRKIRIPIVAILCVLAILCTQEMIRSPLLFAIIMYGFCDGSGWLEEGVKQ